MYCMHCGEEIPDSSRFCKYCGKKVAEADSGTAVQTAAATEPAAYEPAAKPKPDTKPVGAEVPAKEEYEMIDGFFFKGVSPFKKLMLLLAGIVIMLIVAAAVFAGCYPSLFTDVFNIM